MADVIGFFGNTADACFAVDGEQRVVLWNQGAEALTGYRAQEVLGRRCFQVIRGQDGGDHAFCQRCCPLSREAARGRLIASRRLGLRTAAGQRRVVEMGTVVVPSEQPEEPYLIHYLRPLEEPARSAPSQALSDADPGCNSISRLTPREHQVLALLAGGATTAQVAQTLTVTRSTARNHIQHILDKLTAHNRLEAMVLARQHRLLS